MASIAIHAIMGLSRQSKIPTPQIPFTDTKAKQAKPKDKPYKLSEEKGLFLRVKLNGSKQWQAEYRIAGKDKSLSLREYPEITLKQARLKRDKARLQIAKEKE